MQTAPATPAIANRTCRWACLATLVVALGGASPVAAQTVPLISPQFGAPPAPTEITVRLLAAARPTAAFLARASRLAEGRAAARRLRAFASREAGEQEAIEEALSAAAAPTPVTADPLDLAAVAAASVDEGAEAILSKLPRLLRTPGAQSVAVDRAIAERGNDDLARLANLDGRAFDTLYVDTQRDGLTRLVGLYRNYIQNGDDQMLRAVAVHELPKAEARLAALPKV